MLRDWPGLVGCRLAIQLAGMSGAATAPLAAAVSFAGGLGMIGIGRQSPASVTAMLDELDALRAAGFETASGQATGGAGSPVGCTFIGPFATRELIELVAARLGVLEVFYDWPDAERLPTTAIRGWQVGSVAEARAAVDAGCDYVVVQGVEAGGHVRGTAPLAALLPEVREAVDVPVVAAGGIATVDDVRRARSFGADAVRVGTRFVAALESNAHPTYVAALLDARADDTECTTAFSIGWPDAPHRVLSSSIRAAEALTADAGEMTRADGTVLAVPRFGASVPTRDTRGAIEAMALYAGTSVGAVDRRDSAAAIVADLATAFTER